MSAQNKAYQIAPEITTGFILDKNTVRFFFVTPEDSVNYVFNPDVFTLTGYTSTGTLTLSTEDTAHHLHSAQSVMNVGQNIKYTLGVSLSQFQPYTFSVSIKGAGKFRLYIETAGGVQVGGATTIETYSFWNRYYHIIESLNANVATGGRLVIECLQTNHPNTYRFSGWQLSPVNYPLTYFSGNSQSNYTDSGIYWLASPNASISGIESTVPDYGRIHDITDYLLIEGWVGLGFSPVEYQSQTYANKKGSIKTSSQIASRQWSLVGKVLDCSIQDYFCSRMSIGDGVVSDNPIKFIFQLYDCGVPVSQCFEFYSYYQSGLEGNYNNLYGEALAINFINFDPFIYSCFEQAHLLEPNVSFPAGTLLVSKNANGVWDDIPLPLHPVQLPTQMQVAIDGGLYLMSSSKVTKWDGLTDVLVGNAIGSIFTIHAGRDNSLYIGGNLNDFALTPGQSIFKYNISTGVVTDLSFGGWAANEFVFAIHELQDGRIVAGGSTAALAPRLKIFDPTTLVWTDILPGGGFPAIGNVLALQQQGTTYLWIGGNRFGIRLYNLFTGLYETIENVNRRSAIGKPSNVTALDLTVNDILLTRNGEIYICGKFDASDSSNAAEALLGAGFLTTNPYSFARWSGTRWEGLGMIGMTPPMAAPGVGICFSMDEAPNGDIWIGGTFNHFTQTPGQTGLVTTIDPITAEISFYSPSIRNIVKYTGRGLQDPEIKSLAINSAVVQPVSYILWGGTDNLGQTPTFIPSNNQALVNAPVNVNNLYMLSIFNSNIAPNTEIVTNLCGNAVKPKIIIYGQGRIFSVINQTTGKRINFTEYAAIFANEVITIDLSSTKLTIDSTASIYGYNIIGIGSNLSSFELVKGRNYISTEWNVATTDANTKVYLKYKPTYLSIDYICANCRI